MRKINQQFSPEETCGNKCVRLHFVLNFLPTAYSLISTPSKTSRFHMQHNVHYDIVTYVHSEFVAVYVCRGEERTAIVIWNKCYM